MFSRDLKQPSYQPIGIADIATRGMQLAIGSRTTASWFPKLSKLPHRHARAAMRKGEETEETRCNTPQCLPPSALHIQHTPAPYTAFSDQIRAPVNVADIPRGAAPVLDKWVRPQHPCP